MAKESSQKRQARGPQAARVHIEYEVHRPSGTVKRDLPLVVGVLSDLSGNGADPAVKGEFRKRKAIRVEGDVGNAISVIKPRLKFLVKNKLTKSGGEIPVDLEIIDMDGFSPQSVILQVEPLARLSALRRQLVSLRSRAEGKYLLESLLNEVLASTEWREKLQREVKAITEDSEKKAKEKE